LLKHTAAIIYGCFQDVSLFQIMGAIFSKGTLILRYKLLTALIFFMPTIHLASMSEPQRGIL